MWPIKLSPLLFNLRLLSWLAIVASATLVIFSTMIHYARKWIRTHPTSSISRALSPASSGMGAIAKVPAMAKWVGLICIFTSGFAVGWAFHAMQQFNSTDSYRIHVVKVAGPYAYWVQKKTETPWMFQVCRDIGDPEFEDDDLIDVTVLETGPCKSLHIPNGWVGVPNHAKGRTINFQEKP